MPDQQIAHDSAQYDPKPIEGRGSGIDRTRDENGLTKLQDSWLTRMAIRRGWLKDQRWATNISLTELLRIREQRDLTLAEECVLAGLQLVRDENKRTKLAGAKLGLLMERQNQIDDHFSEPAQSGHGSAIANAGQVVVVMPDNGRSGHLSILPTLRHLHHRAASIDSRFKTLLQIVNM